MLLIKVATSINIIGKLPVWIGGKWWSDFLETIWYILNNVRTDSIFDKISPDITLLRLSEMILSFTIITLVLYIITL